MVFEKADKVLYIIILKLLRYLRHGQIAGQQHIFCHLQLLLTDHVGKGDSSFFFQYLRYVIGLVVQCVRTFVQRNISPGFFNHCRVDQWDWEKVIREEDRNETYLKNVVRSIVSAVCATEMNLHAMFPQLQDLPLHTPNVTFITTQELEDKYPDLTPKERENAIVKENGTTFLMKIGAPLKSGKPHDGRAPDYDDWDLNGDLLFWNEPLQCSYELSSMGIRVSPESMDRQLTAAGCDDRRELPFHKAVLNGELPYTIGGGIGQSRLCMLLLGSAHIGEVQASVWDSATREACEKAGIPLL